MIQYLGSQETQILIAAAAQRMENKWYYITALFGYLQPVLFHWNHKHCKIMINTATVRTGSQELVYVGVGCYVIDVSL